MSLVQCKLSALEYGTESKIATLLKTAETILIGVVLEKPALKTRSTYKDKEP